MIRALIYYYIESCWMFLTVISNIKIIKKKRVERYQNFVFNFSLHPRLWLGWGKAGVNIGMYGSSAGLPEDLLIK